MGEDFGFVIVAIGLLAIPVGLMVRFRRTWRVRHAAFLARRGSLTDAGFLVAIGLEATEAVLALAVRRAVAAMCELPAERLHPSEKTERLHALMFWDDGWDIRGFAIRLEEEFDRGLTETAGRGVPPFLGYRSSYTAR